MFFASEAYAQFASLHRQEGVTQVNADFGFVIYSTNSGADLELLRTDLYAEFSFGNAGLYATVPVTSTIGEADNETSWGNFEFGAVHTYSRSEETMGFSLVSHIGIALPTAADQFSGAILNILGSVGRLSDTYASALPDSTSLRIGTSPRIDLGLVELRADVGLDFVFIENAEDVRVYHLGMGAAVDLGVAVISAEFLHVEAIDDAESQTVGVGLTFGVGSFAPSIHYTTSVDEFGDISIVTVGLALVF